MLMDGESVRDASSTSLPHGDRRVLCRNWNSLALVDIKDRVGFQISAHRSKETILSSLLFSLSLSPRYGKMTNERKKRIEGAASSIYLL